MARQLPRFAVTDGKSAGVASHASRCATPISIAHAALLEGLRAAPRVHFVIGDGAMFSGDASLWNPAPPRASLRSFLDATAACERARVTLVSGRAASEIDRWFGGDRVRRYASHGAHLADASLRWQTRLPTSVEWRRRVGAALARVAQGHRRTLLEERPDSFALLCCAFDAGVRSDWVAGMRALLGATDLGADTRLDCLRDAVEVRPRAHAKHVALLDAFAERSPGEMIVVVAGSADEDLLRTAGPTTVVLQIGREPRVAPWLFTSADELLHLLTAFAAPA